MKSTKYNYEYLEFENYDKMEDFIIVNLYEERFLLRFKGDINKGEITVKIWKNGRITDLENKNIKIKNNYWIYNQYKIKDYSDRHKYMICNHEINVKELIWNAYARKYSLKSYILDEFTLFNGYKILDNFIYKDGNIKNNKLNNIILYRETIQNTAHFNNYNNYFELDLEILNDDEEFINIKEPFILKDYPDLEIYKDGRVIDLRGISQMRMDKKGYWCINYKGKQLLVHRLVGQSYLKNKNQYSIVNHIDGNRGNNRIENLEWVNNTINTLHGELKQPKLHNSKDHFCNNIRNKKGNIRISLTSRNYREFVKKKIYQELEMDVKFWLFSNSEPIFLFYIPYRQSLSDFKFPDLLNPDKNKFHKVEGGILKGLDKEEQRIKMIELINRFYSPKNSSDHIINILKELDIDFDEYFNWLFDDLKTLVNDDVGFIYFIEFHRYYQIIKMSDKGVYLIKVENNVFDKHRFRQTTENLKEFNKLINITRYDRVVETLYHYNIKKDNKKFINNYFFCSFFNFFNKEVSFDTLNKNYEDITNLN